MKIDLYLIVSGQTKVRSAKLDAVRSRLEDAHDVATVVVSNHEPEDISPKTVRDSVVLERINSPLYDSFLRTLGPKQVSNSMKHLDALKAISTNTRSGAYPIVLEDDALLPDNFDAEFAKMFDEIPSSWDFVCLGLPGSSPGFQAMDTVYKALPVCNAYMIKQSVASRLSNTFLPLRYITNIHMSYSLEAFGIKPLLYSPQLFIDGSKYGVYVSTLTASNDLIFNKEYVKAKKQLSDGDFRDAMFTINASPLANHPDFLHLKALCELRVDGKAAAMRTFEAALKVLEDNNAVVNNESKFLVDYIELYRPHSA